MENQSKVASLLNQIRSEYEAAQRGLSGLSQGTGQHAFIVKTRANTLYNFRDRITPVFNPIVCKPPKKRPCSILIHLSCTKTSPFS